MEKIFEIVKSAINEIKQLNGDEYVEVALESRIVQDLGFKSLDIAQLIAMLEIEYEKDPFAEGVSLSEVISIGDLCKLYL